MPDFLTIPIFNEEMETEIVQLLQGAPYNLEVGSVSRNEYILTLEITNDPGPVKKELVKTDLNDRIFSVSWS